MTAIGLRCFATLARFQPPEAEAFPIDPGETVASVMARLGIPPGAATLIFVNNVHRKPDAVLADGDSLGLFPPIGGG